MVHRLYRVGVDGHRGMVPAVPRGVLDDPHLFCDDTAQLGAFYTPEATTFRVFAPTAQSLAVVLYDQSSGETGRAAHPLARHPKGIWEATILGDWNGKYYLLAVTGLGAEQTREVVDRKSTRLNSSHSQQSRMPSSA